MKKSFEIFTLYVRSLNALWLFLTDGSYLPNIRYVFVHSDEMVEASRVLYHLHCTSYEDLEVKKEITQFFFLPVESSLDR